MAAESFAERYRHAQARVDGGRCPIEAGVLLNLADNECEHGRLPGDPTPPCGCWPVAAPAPRRVPQLSPGAPPIQLQLGEGRRVTAS